jgi:putative FmdB family regulatory protein
MPTYQYACVSDECGLRFERVQAFTDDAISSCPDCAQRVRKVYGSVGVVFKGSGFYRNDSRKAKADSTASASSSSESSSSDSAAKPAASGNGTSENGKSDSKKADSAGTPTTAPARSSDSKASASVAS